MNYTAKTECHIVTHTAAQIQMLVVCQIYTFVRDGWIPQHLGGGFPDFLTQCSSKCTTQQQDEDNAHTQGEEKINYIKTEGIY